MRPVGDTRDNVNVAFGAAEPLSLAEWGDTIAMLGRHIALRSVQTLSMRRRRTTEWGDVMHGLERSPDRFAMGSLQAPWKEFALGDEFRGVYPAGTAPKPDWDCGTMFGGRRTLAFIEAAIAVAEELTTINCWDLVAVGTNVVGVSVQRDTQWKIGDGPAWWTWFGARALHHFGPERVQHVPAEVVQPLGKGIVVQLTQTADDPSGRCEGLRYAQAMAYWGAECFYPPRSVTVHDRPGAATLGHIPRDALDVFQGALRTLERLGWRYDAREIGRIERLPRAAVRSTCEAAWAGPAIPLKEVAPTVLGTFLGETVRRHVAGSVWGWHGEMQAVAVSPLPGPVPTILPMNTAKKWLAREPGTNLVFWLSVVMSGGHATKGTGQ